MKKIVVIGGGASGMMAASAATQAGADVVLLEKNSELGKKILITGGGRCNITNIDDAQAMMAKIPRNSRFLHSSLRNFDSATTIEFFRGIGLKTKVESGGKVFPQSDDAGDVVAAMSAHLRRLGVKIELDCAVAQNVPRGTFFDIATSGKNIRADAVIIATGGLSAPHTGSDGDGHRIAKTMGHDVTKLNPALVSLIVEGVTGLMGLSAEAAMAAEVDGKVVFKGRGDVMFTHYGLSGPLVLSASAYLAEKMHLQPEICLDFVPDMTAKELDRQILDVFNRNMNKDAKNVLAESLLPQRLIAALFGASGMDADTKVRDVNKSQRESFCRSVKAFRLKVSGTAGFESAVITCGGVDVKQINPSTMASKIVPGLYFAGELLDVHGLTGGYNLQIAFSTGYLAGKSAASAVMEGLDD